MSTLGQNYTRKETRFINDGQATYTVEEATSRRSQKRDQPPSPDGSTAESDERPCKYRRNKHYLPSKPDPALAQARAKALASLPAPPAPPRDGSSEVFDVENHLLPTLTPPPPLQPIRIRLEDIPTPPAPSIPLGQNVIRLGFGMGPPPVVETADPVLRKAEEDEAELLKHLRDASMGNDPLTPNGEDGSAASTASTASPAPSSTNLRWPAIDLDKHIPTIVRTFNSTLGGAASDNTHELSNRLKHLREVIIRGEDSVCGADQTAVRTSMQRVNKLKYIAKDHACGKCKGCERSTACDTKVGPATIISDLPFLFAKAEDVVFDIPTTACLPIAAPKRTAITQRFGKRSITFIVPPVFDDEALIDPYILAEYCKGAHLVRLVFSYGDRYPNEGNRRPGDACGGDMRGKGKATSKEIPTTVPAFNKPFRGPGALTKAQKKMLDRLAAQASSSDHTPTRFIKKRQNVIAIAQFLQTIITIATPNILQVSLLEDIKVTAPMRDLSMFGRLPDSRVAVPAILYCLMQTIASVRATQTKVVFKSRRDYMMEVDMGLYEHFPEEEGKEIPEGEGVYDRLSRLEIARMEKPLRRGGLVDGVNYSEMIGEWMCAVVDEGGRKALGGKAKAPRRAL